MILKKENWKKIALVSVFAIAMAFLEAVFVIYLRKLYYQQGFGFPVIFPLDPFVYTLELFREFATIVMLVCIGLLVGKKVYEKLAYYLYSFAIWDIFYYIFLKITINWPSSLLTWDTLFLIPIQWVGPVLAPLIASFSMIALAMLIIYFSEKKKKVFFDIKEKRLFIIGSIIILYTFLYDYSHLIISGGFLSNIANLLSDPRFHQVMMAYVPINYNWALFMSGEIMIFIGLILFYLRCREK
jgi:hypothetical protein